MQREAYLKQVQGQKEIVMHYIKDHKIVFSEIAESVTEDTRRVFLQWIAQANMNSQKKAEQNTDRNISYFGKKELVF